MKAKKQMPSAKFYGRDDRKRPLAWVFPRPLSALFDVAVA
jgi:hypothetical protein